MIQKLIALLKWLKYLFFKSPDCAGFSDWAGFEEQVAESQPASEATDESR